jgi:hypothetical protein
MKFSKGEVICREAKSYPEGALVCDGYDEWGRMLAHPLGGGFQLTVPAQDEPIFRLVADAERGSALFQRGRFALADSDVSFEGWSNGRLWNGWETPRFEFTVCTEILRSLSYQGARFEASADAFVKVSGGEEETWSAEEIAITDGSLIKVYPLGAGSWIWEEA